jgi:hypothetical protein
MGRTAKTLPTEIHRLRIVRRPSERLKTESLTSSEDETMPRSPRPRISFSLDADLIRRLKQTPPRSMPLSRRVESLLLIGLKTLNTETP